MQLKSKSSIPLPSKQTGFTLVELIVVIVILAILATIAIVAFFDYNRQARDTVRISDINMLAKSMEMSKIGQGAYPMPDYPKAVTFSGGVAWTQGNISDGVIRYLKNISKKPLDPEYGAEYSYSLTAGKQEFEIGSVSEKEVAINNPFIEKGFASDGGEDLLAYTKGNYDDLFVSAKSNGGCYLVATPSLMLGDVPESLKLEDAGSSALVFGGERNLPPSYSEALSEGSFTGAFEFKSFSDPSVLIYTGCSIPESLTGALEFASDTKKAYAGTEFESMGASMEVATTVNADSLVKLGIGFVNNNLKLKGLSGNAIKIDFTTAVLPNFTCAPQPVLMHATGFNPGNPTDLNQEWVYSDTPGNCTFACDNGYAYDSNTKTCIQDVCIGNLGDLNGVMISGSTQSAFKSWEFSASSTPGVCAYKCADGHSYDSGQSKCIPDNCSAQTVTVNGHAYSLPALDHDATKHATSADVDIVGGKINFDDDFKCSLGTISEIGSETQNAPECDTNYSIDGLVCKADTRTHSCGPRPAFTVVNTVGSYTQTWNGSAWMPPATDPTYSTTPSSTSCNYKCDAGNHTEDSITCTPDIKSCTITNGVGSQSWNTATNAWGSCAITSCNSGYVEQAGSCVADVCGGTVPANGVSNATSQTVTKSWTYSATAGQCTFKCDTNYTWNGSNACVANTQTFTCPATKPANSAWNSVPSYMQTWNGSAWLPANSATSYNTTASTTSCRYKCNAAFHTEDSGTSCISDTRSCTIANGVGSQTWNGSSWGSCTVVSCNSGYTNSSNTCTPSNCAAGTQTVNGHSYALAAFNHGATQSKSVTISIAYGTRTYTQNFSCDYGNVSTNGTETDSPNCNTNYTWNGGSCVAGTQTHSCADTRPANAMWNTVSSYVQTWNGSAWSPAASTTAYSSTASSTSCVYKCNPGYHTENSGTSCVSDTRSCAITNGAGSQTWNGSAWGTCNVTSCNSGYVESSNTCVADVCGGTIPSNGTSNATSQTVTKNWTYNTTAGQCTFKCDTNYTWNGSNACVANTQTFSCSAKPANTDWNTVGSYTQTWNGSAWLPANSTTTYNTAASTTSCNYKCSSGFHNESGCISNTRSCAIANGAGSQTWSGTWGTCNVTSCNSGYVVSSNSCIPANCTSPWSTTVNNGTYVTAYSSTTATMPTTCASISESRTCTNGSLGGSYINQNCTQLYRGCSLPWGGSIAHGASVTAYNAYNPVSPTMCASQTRTCSDGVLSGSYGASSCTQGYRSCDLPWGGSIAHGASTTAYASANPISPTMCTSQTRTCNDGALSGSYGASSCTQGYNCSYTTTGWGACSASCGGGTQYYYYSVTSPASGGGSCPVYNGQVAGAQPCNTQSCGGYYIYHWFEYYTCRHVPGSGGFDTGIVCSAGTPDNEIEHDCYDLSLCPDAGCGCATGYTTCQPAVWVP